MKIILISLLFVSTVLSQSKVLDNKHNNITRFIDLTTDTFFVKIIKKFFFSYDDIARFGIRFIINRSVSQKTFFTLGSFYCGTNHIIDYGCEALWASWFNGIKKIPHALLKYALLETCYRLCCRSSAYLKISYPAFITNNFYARVGLKIAAPIVYRHLLAVTFDLIIDAYFENEDNQHENELATNIDSNDFWFQNSELRTI